MFFAFITFIIFQRVFEVYNRSRKYVRVLKQIKNHRWKIWNYLVRTVHTNCAIIKINILTLKCLEKWSRKIDNDSLSRYFFIQNRVIFLGLGPERPKVEKIYVHTKLLGFVEKRIEKSFIAYGMRIGVLRNKQHTYLQKLSMTAIVTLHIWNNINN